MERSRHPLAVKSQNWIVGALLALMKSKQYEAITVKEICSHAGVDRRTFYRNFASKDEVLEYQIQQLKRAYLDKLQNVESRTLHSMAIAEFEFWQHHTDVLHSLYRNGILNSVLLKSANSFVPQIYGLFHEKEPADFHYQVSFLIGGYCNLIVDWVAGGAKETPEQLAQIIADMLNEKNAYWNPYL